jgi:hypothetical protein
MVPALRISTVRSSVRIESEPRYDTGVGPDPYT